MSTYHFVDSQLLNSSENQNWPCWSQFSSACYCKEEKKSDIASNCNDAISSISVDAADFSYKLIAFYILLICSY